MRVSSAYQTPTNMRKIEFFSNFGGENHDFDVFNLILVIFWVIFMKIPPKIVVFMSIYNYLHV